MSETLRDFDLGGEDIELDGYIEMIEAMSAHLRDDQVVKLGSIISERAEVGVVTYDANFDMMGEVESQIRAVHAMRNAIMPGGVVRAGTPAREIKEVVTASSTLLTTLMKMHEKVMSFDRSRAIEEAVSDTVSTLDQEAQDRFFALLKENLSAIR